MNAARSIQRSWISCGSMAMAATTAICGAACNFDPSGTGNGPAPQLCQLDLEPGAPMIDDPPFGLVDEEGLFEYEQFRLHWYISYHAASDDWDGDTGEFTCQIEILKNDELVWFHEFEAESLGKHHGRYDEIIMEEGLPPGTYVARLTVDVDGTVPECSGQTALANNTKSVQFVVQGYPIDDFGTLPSGDDGDDEMLVGANAMPEPDAGGATLGSDGEFSWNTTGSNSDDEPRDDKDPADSSPTNRDPVDLDPVDPNPGSPTPSASGDLTAG